MDESISKSFDIILNKLNGWWVATVAILPNLLLATVIFVTFLFLARFVKGFIIRILPRISGSGKHAISSLFSNIAYIIVMAVGLFITLNILNLNQAVTSLLAGAGIIGLVLGFAFQDLSANFISGIFIALKRPFRLGETVETNGYMGNIEDIQLRTTTIRTFQGLHLMIPNKDIFQKPMINYSRSSERRIELAFTISPEKDIKLVIELCKQAVNKLDYIVKQKPVEVYFTGFADNTLKVAVWFWIYNHKPPGFMVAQNDAIMNIILTLAKHDITIVTPVTFTEQRKQAFEAIVKEKISKNH
jgi:small conductance mechanosensitive channel